MNLAHYLFKYLFQSPSYLHARLHLSKSHHLYLIFFIALHILYLFISFFHCIFCTLSSDNKLGLVDHSRTRFTVIIDLLLLCGAVLAEERNYTLPNPPKVSSVSKYALVRSILKPHPYILVRIDSPDTSH